MFVLDRKVKLLMDSDRLLHSNNSVLRTEDITIVLTCHCDILFPGRHVYTIFRKFATPKSNYYENLTELLLYPTLP